MITTLTRSTSDQVRPAKTANSHSEPTAQACRSKRPNGGLPATAARSTPSQHSPRRSSRSAARRARPRQPQILVHQRREDDNDDHREDPIDHRRPVEHARSACEDQRREHQSEDAPTCKTVSITNSDIDRTCNGARRGRAGRTRLSVRPTSIAACRAARSATRSGPDIEPMEEGSHCSNT